MDVLAATLREYDTVMSIYDVGKTYGPQLQPRSVTYQDLHTGRHELHSQVPTPAQMNPANVNPKAAGFQRSVLRDFARHCFRL